MDPSQPLICAKLAQALAHDDRREEARSLVPASWELVRREPGVRTGIVARSALTYDIGSGGRVVHSDGSGVMDTSVDGRCRRLVDGRLIDRVLTL